MYYKTLTFIIISIIFLSTFSAASSGLNNLEKNKTTNSDDPVPTWNVGNSWTYTINNFIIDYQYENLKLYMTGRIDEFKWSVIDTSGTDYKVSLTGKITANSYEINLPFASRVLHITGSIKPLLTSLTGTIVLTKSDLELKDASASIQGITAAKIYPIPVSLPIPYKIVMDGDLSTLFPLFDFPLYVDKFWSLPSIDITSKLNIGGLFRIFKYPITFKTSYSWTPFAFHCKPKVDVTVQAGTFSAYEITSTFFDIFKYYYAPSVGNLVKIDAVLTHGQIHGELKSYSNT